MKGWFEQYTRLTRAQIPAEKHEVLDEFDLKVEHTYRVRDNCREIARWLELSPGDYKLAELCGLYHDLGRFEQAVRFGTMDDKVTGSHGALSEKVFTQEHPCNGLAPEETAIIAAALRCHGLFAIPESLTGRQRFFTQIVRDADKLDIFHFVLAIRSGEEARRFRMVQYDTEGEVNPDLYAAVMRGENLNAALVKNKTDRTLLELSLIYNLNFGISFQKTLEMRFVERLIGHYDSLKPLISYAEAFMRERVARR